MRYSPSCNCCGGGVGGNCCNGTIPNTMTIQIVMTGSTEFPGAETLFPPAPPGYSCRYPCIDLQGTWVLASDNNGFCYWHAETEIVLVPESCADAGFETITVCFYLWYSWDADGYKRLKLAIIRNSCYGSTYYDILAYAVGIPISAVCTEWISEQTLTPTSSGDISGRGYCDADLDSVSVITP